MDFPTFPFLADKRYKNMQTRLFGGQVFLIKDYIHLMCVHVHMCVHQCGNSTVGMRRSEANWQESALSSQYVGPRDPAEVILLGGKQLYLQSHCADRWVTSLTLNINQNPTLIWFLEVIPAHQFPP